MMHLTANHFARLIVAGIVALAAGAAAGFEITQPIPGSNQTACLDVPAGKTANGTPVVAYPCTGGFNEQWSFDDKGHLESIGTANGETKCLERNGSKVMLGSCNQSWWLNGQSVIFVNGDPENSICLDSRGKYGSTAQVVVDECGAPPPSQRWVLRDIVITQPIPNIDETACVDVSGNAIAEGAPVTAYPCKLAGNERWSYVNGELQGVSSKGATTCLGRVQATNKVELQTCGGTTNMGWYFDAAGHILNAAAPAAPACLDSQSKYGAVQLVLGGCDTSSQIWRLH